MSVVDQVFFYQSIFQTATLLSFAVGMFLGLQACLQLADSQRSYKGATTSTLFLHSFISLFLVFILGAVSSDFGFTGRPLLRIFLMEAIENLNDWKEWTWMILAFISALILGYGFFELMRFEAQISFFKKVFVMFGTVFSLQGIQFFYFEFIK